MNKLQIGKVIKLLRKEKEITQEELANVVGVSIPAVSKWESSTTYPDITVLPVLANFFEVTIDKLMNYKIDLSDDEINEISNECEVMVDENKIEEALSLCEKYLKRYSSNYKFKYRLSSIYVLSFIQIKDKERQKNIIERNIEILEDVVKNTEDIELKELSLIQLSSSYMMNEEPNKAEESIKKMYKPSYDPKTILPLIYTQQNKVEEAKKLMQENLCKSLSEVYISCLSLSIANYNYKEDMDEEEIDFDKAVKYIKLLIGIKSTIPNDKTIYSMYFNLYSIYVTSGDLDKALNTLDTMMEHIRGINLNEYTPLNETWCFDKMEDKTINVNMNVYETIINPLKENYRTFKGNKRFENIIKELQELSIKNKL